MRGDRSRAARAVLAIAAVYAGFLLCAQFGFLAQLERRFGARSDLLHLVLAAMALGGLAASAAAARRSPPALRGSLLATAIACAATTLAGGALSSALAATALGAALGFATVTLAGHLPSLAPRSWWGRVAGAGTGLAYAIANLPPLFAGSPAARALAPAALALLAAALAPRPQAAEAPRDGSSLALPALVLGFGALVLVDSAAFAWIQHDPELQRATWGTAALEWRQGAIHLLAALVAGWLLDRGGLRATMLAAAGLFAVALPALGDPATRSLAAAVYAVGISAYSAALVAAPALSGPPEGAPRRAAWLYAVAGWIGSGLGVGAAESGALRSAAVLGSALFAVHLVLGAGRWSRRSLGAAAPTLAFAALGSLALVAKGHERLGRDAGSPVAQGRAVYLAEGCQHCHSQYVRPAEIHDRIWWGPVRPFERSEHPPTPGTRRLGPDLANVGLRRSAFWNEVHLRSPRSVSPGSRMPAFAHLFADGSGRGEALVAYLDSLGRDRENERARAIARWRPAQPLGGSAARGAALFASYCAPCHGEGGRGDGPVARAVARPTLDLTKGAFFRAVPAPGEGVDVALARAIRFGLSPGSMPGHEWMSEGEIADLVAYVRALAASGRE